MTLRINEPLFYGKPEYLGEDPLGRSVFGDPTFVGIGLLDGKYVLTDGWGYIEIKRCPVCDRNLTEE